MVNTPEMKCYLCGCSSYHRRPGRVRDAEDLKILECDNCGLVFLSRTRLSEKFYEQSGMHGGDPRPVDAWLRETNRDDERRYQYLKEAITNSELLDFGCGVGGFLLKARLVARQVVGIELEERLQPHFRANGLKVFHGIDNIPSNERFSMVTAFHVIEHLEDPAQMLRSLATRLQKKGKIIIEIPSSADALLTLYESVAFSEFTYWSCHLYLFNSANLYLLAKKAGLKLDYVSHIQRYPLSNHLHWLAKGLPGGHQVWSFLDSSELDRAYEASLASLGKTDTLIASMSL